MSERCKGRYYTQEYGDMPCACELPVGHKGPHGPAPEATPPESEAPAIRAVLDDVRARVDGVFEMLNLYAKDPHGSGFAGISPNGIIGEVYARLAPVSKMLHSLPASPTEPETEGGRDG